MKFKYEPGTPWKGHFIVDLEDAKSRKKFAKKLAKMDDDDIADEELDNYAFSRVVEFELEHDGEKIKDLKDLSWSSDGDELLTALKVGMIKGFPLGKISRPTSKSK